MGPVDLPNTIEAAQPAVIQQLDRKAANQLWLYSEGFILLAKASGAESEKSNAGGKKVEIVNQGQVDRMELPAGWSEGKLPEGAAVVGSMTRFHPAGSQNAVICFYYRGNRTSDATSSSFLEVLKKPPHALTPKELKSIGETLRDKSSAQDFKMLMARTELINGKKVLVVEGHYNGFNHDVYSIYIDSDGSGSAVQEIWFEAPKNEYLTYSNDAKKSIKTVKWK